MTSAQILVFCLGVPSEGNLSSTVFDLIRYNL